MTVASVGHGIVGEEAFRNSVFVREGVLAVERLNPVLPPGRAMGENDCLQNGEQAEAPSLESVSLKPFRHRHELGPEFNGAQCE